jgi:hypothetical protein
MVGGIADQVLPVSPVRTEYTNLVVGTEGAGKKAEGVELLDPPAIRGITLPTGCVLHMTGVYQPYLESILLKDLVHRYPVNSR